MAFVAISIDLCGSTRVKQRIVELARGDHAARERMYGAYKRLLYNIERTFYLLILQEPTIDFERLTLIKNIGDELWYAYRIDDAFSEDEAASIQNLLTTLLHLISSDRTLTLAGDGRQSRSNAGVRFDLPIKVYVDLVDHCEELNRGRYEHLKDVVAAARGLTSTVIDLDDDFFETCERLNLSVPEGPRGRRRAYAREDYIGLEIDRFFRLTKQCFPRLLTVGRNLFDFIGYSLTPVAPDYEHLDLKLIKPGDESIGLGVANEPVFAIRSAIASAEMKGISDDYAVYYLFDLPSLGDHFAAPSPIIDGMMDETRGFLAEKGFFAVVDRTRAAAL